MAHGFHTITGPGAGWCFQVFSDHPREHLLSSYYQTGQFKLLSCINLYREVGTIIIPHFIDEEMEVYRSEFICSRL